ncbi:endospore germination permease [Paenibacillus flagellatus]|nr:endospore germination permease [Paenibacillus flagellatus]
MRPDKPFTVLQMYVVLMLSVGISNHVILTPVLLGIAKRDAWVGAVAATVPTALWAVALVAAIRRTGNGSLADWIKERCGRFVRGVILVPFAAYLFVTAWVSLTDTVTWAQVSYLPRTPRIVIVLFFMTVCFFAVKAGIRAIAITSGLLLPGVVLLGDMVATANLKYKDYTLLLPLFTHGYGPALKAMAYTCGSLFELVVILLMKHRLSTRIRIGGMTAFVVLLIGLTVGPVTGAISMFGPFEAAEQRYPAFEQWRMVTMGKFISHLDFFSIYQWIAGSFVRVSLLLLLLSETMAGDGAGKRTWLSAGLCALLAAGTLLPLNDAALMAVIVHGYYPSALVFAACLPILLLALSLLPARRKEGTTP